MRALFQIAPARGKAGQIRGRFEGDFNGLDGGILGLGVAL